MPNKSANFLRNSPVISIYLRWFNENPLWALPHIRSIRHDLNSRDSRLITCECVCVEMSFFHSRGPYARTKWELMSRSAFKYRERSRERNVNDL